MTLQQPKFHKEFRLGLVIYGGVSLAIYMNGVCREFYNAVRGRGIYKLIKALTDSDIVVDIVSGTSAGGINGVLLSYALANSNEDKIFDFENFASVWRDSGDINQLLRKIDSKGDINSILDGEEYYQKQLAEVFQTAWDRQKDAPKGDWYSHFDELDLFVTGTDVLGKVNRYFDNTGKLIEVKDHHALFALKHREGRKEPFKPDKNTIPQRALAKLCRITSCFPVAFPVVSVKLDEKPESPNKDEDKYEDWDIDKKLVEWGNLNNRLKPKAEETDDGCQLHFVDGGVLDNRPFSYTIREIYHRQFYRIVNRKLIYIDPSPDKFIGSSTFKKMAKPNIWEAASNSLVGLPSYESIAGDLQEIARQNENVRRYKYLRSTAVRVMEPKLNIIGKNLSSEDTSAQDSPKNDEISSEMKIYLRCRLVALRDRVLPLIVGLNQDKDFAQNDVKKVLLECSADLFTSYSSDEKKQEVRDTLLYDKGQKIYDLDVDYFIRQHFFILDEIVQLMEQGTCSDCHEDLENLAQYLNRQMSLLEVVRAAINEMLGSECVQDYFAILVNEENDKEERRSKIYDYLIDLHRFLLDNDQLLDEPSSNLPMSSFWLSSEKITDVGKQLRARTDQRMKNCKNWCEEIKNNKDSSKSILCKIQRNSKTIIDKLKDSNNSERCKKQKLLDLSDSLSAKFEHFDLLDQQVYPYEYLSNIQSQDLIEISRISPDDAQKGFGKGKNLEERLAGIQLGAFGGFLKKSWRSNDILWGRLDGLNRLVDCLLTPKTVKSFTKFINRELKKEENLKKTVSTYLSELLTEAFPEDTTTNDEKTFLQTNLKELYDGSLVDEKLESFLEKLVLIGQRAILKTDLENVLKDALDEQFTWNQQLIAQKSGALSYGLVKIRNPTTPQLEYLQLVNTILFSLLNPKSRRSNSIENPDNILQDLKTILQKSIIISTTQKAKDIQDLSSLAQRAIKKAKDLQNLSLPVKFEIIFQSYFPQTKEIEKAKDLQDLSLSAQFSIIFQRSFTQTEESECHNLSDRLVRLFQIFQISKQLNGSSNVPSSEFVSNEFIGELAAFLKSLTEIIEREEKSSTASEVNSAVKKTLGEINQQLRNILNALMPKFSATNGYLDKSLIPFVAGSLVNSSINEILKDPKKTEDYFRYSYRVGSEKINKDIPPIILKALLARFGLVVRDILRSKPTGDVLSKSIAFQFVNRLLITFYFWVEANNPTTTFVPRTLRSLFSWSGLIVIAVGTAFLVSQIPWALLVFIISVLIWQLIYSLIGQSQRYKQIFKVSFLVLLAAILASVLVGLPMSQNYTIWLKKTFSNQCPLIQTKWNFKNCTK
jgi:patatin-related protein